MTNEYKIVKLEPSDYSKCGNIWNMDKNPQMTRKWYGEIVAGNRSVYVYTENGEFIAEAALVYDNGDRDYTVPVKRVYLSRMVVKPDRRNQGIGGILLNFMFSEAKHQGFSEITLGVDKVNTAAYHLYEKNGFTTVLYDGADEHGEYVKLLKVLS